MKKTTTATEQEIMTDANAPDPFGKNIPRQRNPNAPRGVPPFTRVTSPSDPFFFEVETVTAAPVSTGKVVA
jgi:hypothetical protein